MAQATANNAGVEDRNPCRWPPLEVQMLVWARTAARTDRKFRGTKPTPYPRLGAREAAEDHSWVPETLRLLSLANLDLGLYEEGIRQAREALDISEQNGNTIEKMRCLNVLAFPLFSDNQLDAAENAASCANDIAKGAGEEFTLCELHRIHGAICGLKGEKEKAIHHYEMALGIASHFDWHDILFSTHYALAQLSYDGSEFGDATCIQIELAKPHAVNESYKLGRAMEL